MPLLYEPCSGHMTLARGLSNCAQSFVRDVAQKSHLADPLLSLNAP